MTAPDDGLVRCDWAVGRPGPDFALYRDYHDQEWGRPLHGRVPLFERMSLEAFQSGLSWLIILRKRENFRRAFAGFDIEKVARYTDADVARLMADSGNRPQPRQDRGDDRQRAGRCRRRRPLRVAVVVRAGAAAPARDASRRPRHDAGIHRHGTRIEAARVPIRRAHHRVRVDAGDRDGRRSPANVLGAFDRASLKRRPGGHVHLPGRIGNNGGVNLQFNAGDGWNSTGGAYPALTRSATTGQLEPGGSTRWRR